MKLLRIPLLAAFAAGASFTSTAQAQTYTASTGGNWSATTNWTPNGNPNGAGVSIIRGNLSANLTMVQDNVGGVTLGTITQGGGGQFGVTPTQGLIMNFDGTGAGYSSWVNSSTWLTGRLLMNAGTTTLQDDLHIISSGGGNSALGAITISSIITGTGNIVIDNNKNVATAGAVSFAAGSVNTFVGNVNIARGSTVIAAVTNFGNVSSNVITLGSVGGGDATLTNNAGSVSILNNNIVVSGSSGGALLISSTSNITSPTFAGSVTLNGDLTTFSGGIVNTVSSGNPTRGLIFNGVMSGTGGVIVTGTGATRLSGSNTFTGITRIQSGSLAIGTTNTTSSVSLALQGSTVNLAGADTGSILFGYESGSSGNPAINAATFGGLTGSRNLNLVNSNTIAPAGVALSVGANNTNQTYTGTLTGAGSVIKVGTGTWTVTATHTYTGSTAINAGTLVINGAVGNGGVSVETAGTLKGNVTAGGTTTVAGTLAVGNSPGTGNFEDLVLLSTSETEIEFNAGATELGRGTEFDAINVSSDLTYDGTGSAIFLGAIDSNQTFDIFSFVTAPTGSFDAFNIYAGDTLIVSLTYDSGVWTGAGNLGYGDGTQSFTFTESTGDLLVAVPEPSTTVLLGLGLTGALVLFRRRKVS